VLLSGARRNPPRAAVAAAFIALVFHTLLYADFLEDPFTWALLWIGVALGYAPLPRLRPEPARSEALATA
jgi:putative inorganic carbon (hco3(-)) transporter